MMSTNAAYKHFLTTEEPPKEINTKELIEAWEALRLAILLARIENIKLKEKYLFGDIERLISYCNS